MSDYTPPDVKKFRWPVLILCCFMVSGRYYCFDIPAVVYDKLEHRFHGTSDFVLDFNLMYTFYCFPNIFLPLVGGHFVDKFGQRTMIIVFTTCAFIGQFIVAFGCTSRHFHLILVGRFLFGFGESLNVSVITILTSFFAQGELAFAVTILFLSTRLCTFLNMLMSPLIELSHGVSAAFWIGALVCVLSVVSSIILAEVDEVLKSPYSHNKTHSTTLDIGRGTDTIPVHKRNTPTGYRKRRVFSGRSSVPSPLPVVMEDDVSNEMCVTQSADSIISDLKNKQQSYGTFRGNEVESGIVVDYTQNVTENNYQENPNLFYIDVNSKRTLICLYLLCFCLYGSILPFFDMTNPIIHIGYFHGSASAGMTPHERELLVTRLQSIPVLILTVCAPCIAVMVDYRGNRPSFYLLASTLLVIGHCLVAARLGEIMYLIIALVLIGVAHGITIAVTWTCVQYLVSPHYQGFATGILLSIYHMSQSIVPIIVSYIITAKISFVDSHVTKHKVVALEIIDIKNCESFFIAMSISAVFFSFLVFFCDENGHGALSLSGLITSHQYQMIGNGEDFDDIRSDDELRDVPTVPIAFTSTSGTKTFPIKFNSEMRPRSKSMSDTSPLTSCMRKYYMKRRNKDKGAPHDTSHERISGSDDRNNTESKDENCSDDDCEVTQSNFKRSRRSVSFSGETDFSHERRIGEGQHPLVTHLPHNASPPLSPYSRNKKIFFAHF